MCSLGQRQRKRVERNGESTKKRTEKVSIPSQGFFLGFPLGPFFPEKTEFS